jgi:dTMP kinase
MHVADDTPEPDGLPAIYPRDAPVNLLSGAALRPGNFYSFEGIDGSGKTSLARAVAAAAQERGWSSVLLRLGKSELLRHAIERAKWLNADPLTLNLLNWVSIAHDTASQHHTFNRAGSVVLFDRYTMTVKLRGLLEGLDLDYMDQLERSVPRPRAVFLVDAPVELCLQRIRAGGRAITYFEAGYRNVERVGQPMRERSSEERSSSAGREQLLLLNLDRMRRTLFELASGSAGVHRIDNTGDLAAATGEVMRVLGADQETLSDSRS